MRGGSSSSSSSSQPFQSIGLQNQSNVVNGMQSGGNVYPFNTQNNSSSSSSSLSAFNPNIINGFMTGTNGGIGGINHLLASQHANNMSNSMLGMFPNLQSMMANNNNMMQNNNNMVPNSMMSGNMLQNSAMGNMMSNMLPNNNSNGMNSMMSNMASSMLPNSMLSNAMMSNSNMMANNMLSNIMQSNAMHNVFPNNTMMPNSMFPNSSMPAIAPTAISDNTISDPLSAMSNMSMPSLPDIAAMFAANPFMVPMLAMMFCQQNPVLANMLMAGMSTTTASVLADQNLVNNNVAALLSESNTIPTNQQQSSVPVSIPTTATPVIPAVPAVPVPVAPVPVNLQLPQAPTPAVPNRDDEDSLASTKSTGKKPRYSSGEVLGDAPPAADNKGTSELTEDRRSLAALLLNMNRPSNINDTKSEATQSKEGLHHHEAEHNEEDEDITSKSSSSNATKPRTKRPRPNPKGVSSTTWNLLLVEHVKAVQVDSTTIPTLVTPKEWVELFRGLEIVTQSEFDVLLNLINDPAFDGTVEALQKYIYASNKKNELLFTEAFGWNYVREQARYGRVQMLSIMYWSCYVLYCYHLDRIQPMLWSRAQFEAEYIEQNPVDGSKDAIPIFNQLEDLEIQRLVLFRNLIVASFYVLPAHLNEALALQIVVCLERTGKTYKFSGPPTHVLAMNRRKLIYRHEANRWAEAH